MPDPSFVPLPAPSGQSSAASNPAFIPLPPPAAPPADETQKPPSAFQRFTESAAGGGQPSDIWEGPKYAIEHPIDSAKLLWNSVTGSQQQLIDRAYKEQHTPGQRVQGFEHGMESAIPLVGPLLAHITDQWSNGDIAGGMGSLAQVLPMFAGDPEDMGLAEKSAPLAKEGEALRASGGAEVPKGAGFAKTAAQTVGTKAKATQATGNISHALENFRTDSLASLQSAVKETRAQMGQVAQAITAADKMDAPEGSIPLAPFQNALKVAREYHQQAGGPVSTAEKVGKDYLALPPGYKLSFEEAQQLRTRLGDTLSGVPSHDQAIVSQARNQLTQMLDNRALQLDQKFSANGEFAKAWTNFNKRWSEFSRSSEGVLSQLQDAKTGSDFSKVLNDPKFRAQLDRAMLQMRQAGMSPELLEQWKNISKPLAKVTERHGGFGGMMGAIYARPIVGAAGYEAGRGFGWIPRMVGIAKMSEVLDRIKAMQTVLNNNLDMAPRVTPQEGNASIAEQMAAKGQTPLTPEAFGGNGSPSAPAEEPKPVQTNGSGASKNSAEDISRRESMQAKQEKYVSVDTRTGAETPIPDNADAHDRANNPGPYERTYKVNANGQREIVMEGDKARGFESRKGKFQEIKAKAATFNKFQSAKKTVEKGKEGLSPEEYKLATDYLAEIEKLLTGAK